MKRFFRRMSRKKKESNLHRAPVKASWPSTPSNSLPATDKSTNPTSLELQHNTIPAAGLQEHDSTKADSFNTWHTSATSELDKQATPLPFRHAQSIAHVDVPVLQLSCSSEGIVSGSPSGSKLNTKLGSCLPPSDVAPRNSTRSPQHQLANIYRSYNDIDILSSNSFDFSQDQLLASAPDADWPGHVLDRIPDRRNTVKDLPQNLFSSQWGHHSTRTPSTQGQPISQLCTTPRHSSRNPAQFSSPDELVRFRTVPYKGPSPVSARQGGSHCPATQPVVTPFAKYASIATSGPLLSADLDTAMPVNGQVPVQPHQDGSYNGHASGEHYELLPSIGSFVMQ